MRNKILIGVGIALAVFVFILLIFAGGASTPDTGTQTGLISGIQSEIKNEQSKFYEFSKLTDNIQFNSEIENKIYTKLNIKGNENYNSLGIVFLVKTSSDCNITFTLCKNEETLKTVVINFTAGVAKDVVLILSEAAEIKTTDNYFIEIENASETSFVFDSLLCFFENSEE